ncbi:prolyl oligopeptidase family serine peptidase [Pendulispora albinea]|uniref:prolyl oligopeptidase n=1 Tax=Pendulispora albinea TaxID=2741071 RepID=A0ABZ2M4C8_9BACT
MRLGTRWIGLAGALVAMGIGAEGCVSSRVAQPATPEQLAPPATPKRPETFRAAGRSFVDDYGWLRDANDPEVARWIDAQDAWTTKNLGSHPYFGELRARFDDLARRTKQAANRIEGTGLRGAVASPAGVFVLRRPPAARQAAIFLRSSPEPDGAERVVLDPAALDPSGQTSIDWYVASADGQRLAVSLSKDGSEDGNLSVFDVASGKLVDGPIPRVTDGTAGGSAAFSRDGKTLFYTQYPAPGSQLAMHLHQQLHRHTLGAPLDRDERVPLELPAIAEIQLLPATEDGTLVASVNVGDGGDRLWFVGQPSAKGFAWSQLAGIADAIDVAGTSRGALYLLSRKGDPRGAIVRVPTRAPRLSEGKVIVPTEARELTNLAIAGDTLVVFDIAGGPTRARAFDPDGKPRGEIALPPRSAVSPEMAWNGALYVSVVSYTEPLAMQRLDPGTLQLKATAMSTESPVRFDDVSILDEVAIARDGTRVPITLIARRGAARSKDTPVLLTGYGGYRLWSTPNYDPRRRVWLDQGGMLAIAHIRGGNENGARWHDGGRLGNKQNVFDDFIACAEHLLREGYTSKNKLAIWGRSNGGLLVGAVLTQRPDLFRAAVMQVPVLDMVRFQTWPNGVFNTTELGTLDDPVLGPKILAYSPYQNAKPAAYPAVLILSGMADRRVDPADARAFAAKLQAISTSNHPILLRTWSHGGHFGSNAFQRADEDAQIYAFLLRELEVSYRRAETR